MQIVIDRRSSTPLYSQVAQEILRRIRSGALPPGSRLPTIRALSEQLSVTRLTVHAAYNELQAGGWIESTVGRGTFVADAARFGISAAEFGREATAGGFIHDMLHMAQMPGMRSLAMADAAAEFYPQRDFARALDEALAGGAGVFGYTTPQGEPVLRTVLAELLADRGMRVTPDELLVTSGVTQGLAIVAQALASPGDTVLVEQPTYLGALSIFGGRGLRLVGVPVDDQGMQTDELDTLIPAHRPRFIYLVPAFQNPTGVTLSRERRAQLLAVAARHQIAIIEDDIYAPLAYEGPPPRTLYADDTTGMVINLGSFSKVLLPGIRVGYLVAPSRLIPHLARIKQTSDLCSPPMLQRAMASFIQRGWLANHLRRTLPRYRERRDAMLGAMTRYFPSGIRWTEPQGGFCVWVTLPMHVNVLDLYLTCIEHGVAFAPGDAFFAGSAPQPYMRLAYSVASPESIKDIIRTIGHLLDAQVMRRGVIRESSGDFVPLV